MSQQPRRTYFLEMIPGHPNILLLNGRGICRCPPPSTPHYFPPEPQHVIPILACHNYYTALLLEYCHSDLIWIRSLQAGRHHLDAQLYCDPALSQLITIALYNWEGVNTSHRSPEEVDPMHLTGAIAERLLSRIEDLERIVSSSPGLPGADLLTPGAGQQAPTSGGYQ